MAIEIKDNALLFRRLGETLRIEPWGRDSLRVRSTMESEILDQDWALTEVPAFCEAAAAQQSDFRALCRLLSTTCQCLGKCEVRLVFLPMN